MQVRIGHSGMVIDFVDVNFNSNQIGSILEEKVRSILENFSLEGLDDWALEFMASYTNRRQPLVSKNKLVSFTSDKIKQITIAIPIPTVDIVPWGVEISQHIFQVNHFDNLIQNFYPLDVICTDYSNRTDYILACMREGIKKSFTEGFTVNKVKFKLKNLKTKVANTVQL
jgi:hypothetical protein